MVKGTDVEEDKQTDRRDVGMNRMSYHSFSDFGAYGSRQKELNKAIDVLIALVLFLKLCSTLNKS